MLIIINDDRAYLSWLAHHRQGYVLDAKRKPAKHHVVLHRATCSIIKPHKRARLTSGAHLKACSLDAEELATWAREETGGEAVECPACEPLHDEAVIREGDAQHAPTRLGRDVLSYLLDLAVMFLDGEQRAYAPRVDDVAAYLAKSNGQIMPALRRLIADRYVDCTPAPINGAPSAAAVLYPTAAALQTIPAFAEMDNRAVDAELARLRQTPES